MPKDFAADGLDLTATSPGGASAYRLTVDRAPAVKEKEPNNGFAQAQELTLPATVDGKFEQEKDVDVYRFAGKAGERVRVEVRAARLGSPADAAVTVFDADRRVLDTSDDADGTADPALTVTLPRDGVYFVSVSEANDLGGDLYRYRLVLAKAK